MSLFLFSHSPPMTRNQSNIYQRKRSVFATKVFSLYHVVTFHFLFRNKNNGLLNLDPPLKSAMPLGAKTTRADSTLEMAPPSLFLDPVSRSGSANILYYLRMF